MRWRLAIAVAAVALGGTAHGQEKKPEVSFEEKLLATVPEGVKGDEFSFSSDGRTVAYAAHRGEPGKDARYRVTVGDHQGEEFDAARYLIASPVGSHFAYVAAKGRKLFIVVGDKKGEEFDNVEYPAFSSDGTVVAYWAITGQGREARRSMVVGDRKGPPMEGAPGSLAFGVLFSYPVFRPNTDVVAYTAQEGGKCFIVLGDKRGEAFDEVTAPEFSRDGSTMAYAAATGKEGARKWFVVVGDQRGEQFDFVSHIAFSPDGKTVAYGAREGKKWFVVVGDKRGREFSDLDILANPIFSPDGRAVAYAISKNGKSCVVVGEREGEQFFQVFPSAFSPDGSKVACLAMNPGKWFVVAGETHSEALDNVDPRSSGPYFSPDGSKVAYGAMKGRELWWKVMAVK